MNRDTSKRLLLPVCINSFKHWVPHGKPTRRCRRTQSATLFRCDRAQLAHPAFQARGARPSSVPHLGHAIEHPPVIILGHRRTGTTFLHCRYGATRRMSSPSAKPTLKMSMRIGNSPSMPGDTDGPGKVADNDPLMDMSVTGSSLPAIPQRIFSQFPGWEVEKRSHDGGVYRKLCSAAERSGAAASLSEMIVGSSGHSIPIAGSLYRIARSASGVCIDVHL